jgi:protein SCO1/2
MKIYLRCAALALSLGVFSTISIAHDAPSKSPAATGSSSEYAFPLPEPGSYELPPIGEAGGGRVLDETSHFRNLAEVVRGQVTVLAFIYTRCGDICPTATLQLSLLRDRAADHPELVRAFRLVSMSFDPDHDTPSVMAEYAELWRSSASTAPEWLFLTAPDREALEPILAGYNQSIGPKPDPNSPTGPIYHIFRAFLIDRTGTIRNIYSLDFLDPALVLTDIRSLLLEDKGPGDRTR